MTSIKERAVEMIQKIPDESMIYIVGILQNFISLNSFPEPKQSENMPKFKASAGKINIDTDAVINYRLDNMI